MASIVTASGVVASGLSTAMMGVAAVRDNLHFSILLILNCGRDTAVPFKNFIFSEWFCAVTERKSPDLKRFNDSYCRNMRTSTNCSLVSVSHSTSSPDSSISHGEQVGSYYFLKLRLFDTDPIANILERLLILFDSLYRIFILLNRT